MKSCFTFAMRRFCSRRTAPHVCVVGAGPAGFYAAMHLTKYLSPVKIDIIEKLPVPFGLVRYVIVF